LYTGACPQTLVFEALGRARHLEFLHESQQNQTVRPKVPLRATKPKSAPIATSKTKTTPEPMKRPDSVALTNNTNEPFIESNTTTPVEELNSYLIPTDPMTTSFVDGAPNTRNPFSDKTEDVEIIHHNLSLSNNKIPMPAIDEINPQGLPMKRNSATTTTTTTTTTVRKTKTATLTGSVFYVDVAYIPYHGNEHYVDSEFFRRIRARYYVLNAVEISRLTLESLIEGKQQWDKQEQTPVSCLLIDRIIEILFLKKVTLVPTFDGDQLRQFFVFNKTRLTELNINIIPASTRCNVQYDDEGSPAQRLRFNNEP